MNIKGTQSEKNIKAAFAGEAQARSKYTYYADIARKEGNIEVAELFERMAKNELAHARIWFNLINPPKDSGQNLSDAAMGESYEWNSMYPDFAKQARQDGLEDLAVMFEKVGEIEKLHERTFMEMIAKLMGKPAPKAEDEAERPAMNYRCMFCGSENESRPDVCSVCGAIGSFERI